MTAPAQGYIALLLHAHLPYVRQDKEPLTLEERWFYEAVSDTYLPVIETFDRLITGRVDFRLTLSLSPTLLAMMEDPLMKQKTRQHLVSLHELAQKEVLRLWADADYVGTARHYAERFARHLKTYDRLQGDLIAKLRSLHELGCVELIPCAATHAFLPLVKNAEALRAQLEAAVTEFRRHFGRTPAGIWLPECGYTPAVEPHLQALGLRYFVASAHAVGHAKTKAKARPGAPLRTHGGAAAFARDPEASTGVWSAEAGYPGDPEYREYYRDIGFDLGRGSEAEWRYIKPYVLPDGERIHTGLKYHRVTGRTDAKEPYRPELAARKAQQHAEHFLAARAEQAVRDAEAADHPEAPPLIVCPYDAELFGHWWYEGPIWLESVLRGLDRRSESALQSITLSEYLHWHPPTVEARLPVSSWGRGGYADVWLQPATDWIYPQLHEAEDRLIRIAGLHRFPEALSLARRRILNQAAKELMLAQSSDWAFILDSNTVVAYAQRRIREHLGHFHLLLDHFESSWPVAAPEIELLIRLEQQSPLFPTVSYTSYLPADNGHPAVDEPYPIERQPGRQLRILMLTWEYPPLIIGGLARAVCDLSRHLAAAGHNVHVLTCYVPDSPKYETTDGVHIHRVPLLQSISPVNFLDWVFQMNLAFTDYIDELARHGRSFDLIHAHDWLVYYSAVEGCEMLQAPLTVTMHATESGRNLGSLQSDLQKSIHHMEFKLTNRADRIITCSRQMTSEVQTLFALPPDKLLTIPNGVEAFSRPLPSLSNAGPSLRLALGDLGENRILCFLGRLVPEKGIHILIQAMPMIVKHNPSAKLIIAGTGPMLEQLIEQAAPLGERIQFTGFLQDADKCTLLRTAELCIFPSLYEPFGIVALEAMICETPVIVSDVGGLGEMVGHGIDGYKVPPGDADALARQVIEAMRTPDQSQRIARAAADKARNDYNWSAISKQTVEVYYSLA